MLNRLVAACEVRTHAKKGTLQWHVDPLTRANIFQEICTRFIFWCVYVMWIYPCYMLLHISHFAPKLGLIRRFPWHWKMWACFIDDLTDEDLKKLDIIKKVVLMSGEQSRGKRKERVKKYLIWVRVSLKLTLNDL